MYYVAIDIKAHFEVEAERVIATFRRRVIREDMRAWMWEHGIRHTVHFDPAEDVMIGYAGKRPINYFKPYVGFYNVDDAFAFKMRWV